MAAGGSTRSSSAITRVKSHINGAGVGLTPLVNGPYTEIEGFSGFCPNISRFMLIAKEFVTYLSRQMAAKLADGSTIEITNIPAVAELINNLIVEELSVEDRLNDEVRTLLEEYSVYMTNNGISYSEMFRKIKNQLIQQRKIVRASGRDTGDAMKLSRDKINEMSHRIVTSLRKSRDCRLRKDSNDVRLEIVRLFSEILLNEDKADKAARAKIRTMKRDVQEGTEEWDLLHKRYYAEELKSLGIDLARN